MFKRGFCHSFPKLYNFQNFKQKDTQFFGRKVN